MVCRNVSTTLFDHTMHYTHLAVTFQQFDTCDKSSSGMSSFQHISIAPGDGTRRLLLKRRSRAPEVWDRARTGSAPQRPAQNVCQAIHGTHNDNLYAANEQWQFMRKQMQRPRSAKKARSSCRRINSVRRSIPGRCVCHLGCIIIDSAALSHANGTLSDDVVAASLVSLFHVGQPWNKPRLHFDGLLLLVGSLRSEMEQSKQLTSCFKPIAVVQDMFAEIGCLLNRK